MNYKYDEIKATQAAVYLIKKYNGSLNYMKLIKLLYMANRVSIQRYSEPIVPDVFVSMPRGPVLSGVLDSINDQGGPKGYWSKHISITGNVNVKVVNDPGFDCMNRRSLKILDDIDKEWHNVDPFEIVKWMHKNLPEWENPGKTSMRIPPHRIMKAVGKSDEEILYLEREELTYQEEEKIIESIESEKRNPVFC